jgi:hypothetical protein
MERIEINEKYKGYEYIVYATPMGHRCGYVEIPKGHYLYGKHYHKNLRKIKFKEIENNDIDKISPIAIFCAALSSKREVNMEILFNVHGGITWSGKGKDLDMNRVGWWIGFDCAHCEDAKDPEIIEEDKKHIWNDPCFGENEFRKIRTKEYVEQECKNLIDQIIKYFDKEDK